MNKVFYLFFLLAIALECLFWYSDSQAVGYSIAEDSTWKIVLGVTIGLLLLGVAVDLLTKKKSN